MKAFFKKCDLKKWGIFIAFILGVVLILTAAVGTAVWAYSRATAAEARVSTAEGTASTCQDDLAVTNTRANAAETRALVAEAKATEAQGAAAALADQLATADQALAVVNAKLGAAIAERDQAKSDLAAANETIQDLKYILATVQEGDTLTGLWEEYEGDENDLAGLARWIDQVVEKNGLVAGGDLIVVGTQLQLPPTNGG